MGKIIRVGIIGLGRSGSGIHADHLNTQSKRFKIVAVADQLPERRKAAIEKYKCVAYADWKSLLEHDDIDLIVNASPTKFHVPVSQKCLGAGFHVLCEKPLASRAADVDKLARVAKKARKQLIVFQCNRFDPMYLQVKKIVDSGKLGRIVMIKAQACGFSRRWDWQTTRKELGGSLLNTGSHNLDQLLQFYKPNTKPSVTSVMDRTLTFGDAEDHVKIILKAPGEPTIDLEISSCCAYPGGAFTVYGTRGGLNAKGKTVSWKYYNPKKQAKRKLNAKPISDANGNPAYCWEKINWVEKEWQNPLENPFEYNITRSYDAIYNCLARGKDPAVTLQQVRRQIAVIEECHKQNPTSRMQKADIPS